MAPGDETFRKAAAIITVGMVLPALPVAVAGDFLVARVSYWTFLGVSAVGFGVVSTGIIEWWSLDRRTVAVASVVWPWVVFFTALFGILLLNEGEQIARGPLADVVRTLYGNNEIWGTERAASLAYGAAFMIAGLGAVGVSVLLQRRSSQATTQSG